MHREAIPSPLGESWVQVSIPSKVKRQYWSTIRNNRPNALESANCQHWIPSYMPWCLDTRKPSYLKDDRAIHTQKCVYMGALKISRESLSMPTATAEIFNGLLFRSILWMCVQNLKFVALPIPGIIAITVLGWGWEPLQSWEGEAVGGRGWYRSKERCWVPIGLP